VSDAAPIPNREVLESILRELARELAAEGLDVEVVMVGGAWLLWHTERSATRDVDSVVGLDASAKVVVERVGRRRGMAPDWLNDRAAGFWPVGVDRDQVEAVLDEPGLRVCVPPASVVFVMKLYRGHAQDYEDMVSIWPMCEFDGPEAAVDAFWSGYPHALDDPHLLELVSRIAAESGEADP